MIKWFLLHFFVALLKLVFLSSRLQSLVWLLAQFFAVVWVNRMRSVRIYAVADSISSWGRWSRRTLGRIRARRLVVFTQIDDCASKLVLSYICCVQHWSRRLFWYRGTKICWHNKWDAVTRALFTERRSRNMRVKIQTCALLLFLEKKRKIFFTGEERGGWAIFLSKNSFSGSCKNCSKQVCVCVFAWKNSYVALCCAEIILVVAQICSISSRCSGREPALLCRRNVDRSPESGGNGA